MPRPARSLAVLLLAVAACVAGPLEHTNYFDAKSGSSIAITDLPDSVFSSRDTFEFTVESAPEFPSGILGAAVTFVSGRSLLAELGGFRFAPTGITVFPQSVTFAAHVNPVRAWPVDTQTLWMVQRAQTLALSCFNPGCQSIVVSSGGVALVTGTDYRGAPLSIPTTGGVYGTATSSDTLVFRVTGRTGPRIALAGIAPGSAMLSFTANGVLTTLPITVSP